MRILAGVSELRAAVGDHQWIHTDPERAANGPFGATIAHGYLTLSLIPELISVTERCGGQQVLARAGIDRDGGDRPVCVADTVSMVMF